MTWTSEKNKKLDLKDISTLPTDICKTSFYESGDSSAFLACMSPGRWIAWIDGFWWHLRELECCVAFLASTLCLSDLFEGTITVFASFCDTSLQSILDRIVSKLILLLQILFCPCVHRRNVTEIKYLTPQSP